MQAIKKGSFSMSFTYCSGNFSNNLYGKNAKQTFNSEKE